MNPMATPSTSPERTDWEERLDRMMAELQPELMQVRRHLHAHPETSGEEFQTTGYLREKLLAESLQVRVPDSGRGLIVEPPDQGNGPRAAFRGDMDALRIQDAKSCGYRSRVPGIMHACGHDGHATIALGTCLALIRLGCEGLLPAGTRWRGILQPAEETNQGALEMIAAGALDSVGAIFTQHLDPSRSVGMVALRPGPMTANCDEVEIRIQGRGGHAARPHESLDPIAAAAQLINSLYLYIPRSINAHEPVVLTIGQIQGGEGFNIIPDHALLRGTLRSFGHAVRERTLRHIRQLARGLAEASGTRIEVRFNDGPPSVHNDPALVHLVTRCAQAQLGEMAVESIEFPSMGGEDFAHYISHVPGCMHRLGCAAPGQAEPLPLHSPEFDFDESALSIGVNLLARSVITWRPPSL